MERIDKKTKVKGEKNNMAANVETMFSVREKPWHDLGVVVEEAPSSEEALRLAGLDWRVVQKSLYTNSGLVDGYKANVRESDNTVLGVVTDRYKVVQNTEAFAFTDNLLGEGVKYETAGSLQGGKKVWILARLPREYIMSGERITPYLVFSNSDVDAFADIEKALDLCEQCAESGFKDLRKRIIDAGKDREILERRMMKELDLLYTTNVEADI